MAPQAPHAALALSAPALPHEVEDVVRAAIDAGTLELPVMPRAMAQVLAATSDPQCDARKLAELLRHDAALSGHLLRIANSPLYAPATQIISVQQAVTRLGLAQVRQIALLISCETTVFRVPGHEGAVREIFRHSLLTALFAQEIARARRWNVEEAFLAGLLHDLGRPVLLHALLAAHARLRRVPQTLAMAAFSDAEHARVGSLLLERWGLSPRLVEVVRHHHEPASAPNQAQAAWVASYADGIAHAALAGAPALEATRTHPALAPLNLYAADVDRLHAQRDRLVAAAESLQ